MIIMRMVMLFLIMVIIDKSLLKFRTMFVCVIIGTVVMRVPMRVIMVIVASKVVVSISRVQNFHLNKVEKEAHNSSDEHDVSLYSRWVDDS